MPDLRVGPLGLTREGRIDVESGAKTRYRSLASALRKWHLDAYGWPLSLPPQRDDVEHVREALKGIDLHGVYPTGSPYKPATMQVTIQGKQRRLRHTLRAIAVAHAEVLGQMGAKSITIHPANKDEATLAEFTDDLRLIADEMGTTGVRLHVANGSFTGTLVVDGLQLADLANELGIGATYFVHGEWGLRPTRPRYEEHLEEVLRELPQGSLAVYAAIEMRQGKRFRILPMTGSEPHAEPPLDPLLAALQAHGPETLLVEAGGQSEVSAGVVAERLGLATKPKRRAK